MKTWAVCALVMLTAVAPAMASEAPSLRLDLERTHALSIDAHAVTIEQVLAELGKRLNFTVEFAPGANRSAAVNGKFQGALDEVLADILRETTFVARYGEQGLKHVVVMASSTGAASTTAISGAPANVLENKPVAGSMPAGSSVIGGTGPVAQSAAPFQAVPDDSKDRAPPGMVSKLLENQAGVLVPRDQSAAAAPPQAAGGQSMAVMTRATQAKVQALVAALNNACIGENCSH